MTAEYIQDYAEIAGIELLQINDSSTIQDIKRDIRLNDIYYSN